MTGSNKASRRYPTVLKTGIAAFGAMLAIWVAADQLVLAHGLLVVGSATGLVLFVSVLLHVFAAQPSRRRGFLMWGSGVMACVSGALLVLGFLGGAPHRQVPSAALATPSHGRNAVGAPTLVPAVRAAKTAPVPRSRLLSNSDTCGPEAQVSHPLPDVQLNVVYWCKGEVFLPNGTWDKAHIQVKLRPRIINNSAHSITIGIGKPATIRLLVKSAQLPSGWDPPPNTASGGDKPVLVTWDGEQLWAVPPNVNGDATAAANDYYTGFATKWQATSLVSGGSYFNPLTYDANRQPDRNGDLVFQLPLDSRGRVEIVGLAVVTPSPSPTVLAVAQQIDWPASSEPSSF